MRLHDFGVCLGTSGGDDACFISLALIIDNIAHYSCNLQELRLFKLPQDSLQLRFLNQIGQLKVILCTRLKVSR
jgi:hypothetical protein